MVNYTEWFTERTNGKIQINSTAIYRYLSLEVVERLDSNLSVNEIIDWIRSKTREAFSTIAILNHYHEYGTIRCNTRA